jgi:hypothetical protein
MTGMQKREKEKEVYTSVPFRGLTPMMGKPPTKPYYLKFPPLPSSVKLGTKPLT